MNAARPAQTPASESASAETPPARPEELRANIEQTRAQLGETVEALVAKTNVKARAQHQATAAFQRGASLARGLARQASQQADNMAGHLETATARRLPPTADDPARARRAAQRVTAGVAALTAVAGLIAGWLSRRNRHG